MLLRKPRRRAAALTTGRPVIAYGGSPFSWQQGVALGATAVTNTGGAATSFVLVAGSLPTGLSLNASTGALTGTPSTAASVAASGTATIRAYGTGGSCDAVLTWSVAVEAPVLTYAGSPFAWVQGVSIGALVLPSNAGDPVASYAVQAGALVAGLALNATTGAITGTPTALAAAGTVTVRATNAGGTSDFEVLYVVAAA